MKQMKHVLWHYIECILPNIYSLDFYMNFTISTLSTL